MKMDVLLLAGACVGVAGCGQLPLMAPPAAGPEVLEFEGFVNYGEPIETKSVTASGEVVTVVLTD